MIIGLDYSCIYILTQVQLTSGPKPSCNPLIRAVAMGGGGVQGVQLKPPPPQINDIHDYCYALKKLRAEMHLLFHAHSTHIYLELTSFTLSI